MNNKNELLNPQEVGQQKEKPSKKVIKKDAGDIVERKEVKVVTEDGKELL